MFIPAEKYQYILDQMPIVCVDVLIVFEGKCLLLLRDNEPAKGMYWFPGGRILKNETIRQAALRKAKEETNLSCTFIKIVSTEESLFLKEKDMNTDLHTVNVCCLLECDLVDQLSIDHLHVSSKWVSRLDDSLHSAVRHPLSLIGFD